MSPEAALCETAPILVCDDQALAAACREYLAGRYPGPGELELTPQGDSLILKASLAPVQVFAAYVHDANCFVAGWAAAQEARPLSPAPPAPPGFGQGK